MIHKPKHLIYPYTGAFWLPLDLIEVMCVTSHARAISVVKYMCMYAIHICPASQIKHQRAGGYMPLSRI